MKRFGGSGLSDRMRRAFDKAREKALARGANGELTVKQLADALARYVEEGAGDVPVRLAVKFNARYEVKRGSRQVKRAVAQRVQGEFEAPCASGRIEHDIESAKAVVFILAGEAE